MLHTGLCAEDSGHRDEVANPAGLSQECLAQECKGYEKMHGEPPNPAKLAGTLLRV
jgi:hypothetical protein